MFSCLENKRLHDDMQKLQEYIDAVAKLARSTSIDNPQKHWTVQGKSFFRSGNQAAISENLSPQTREIEEDGRNWGSYSIKFSITAMASKKREQSSGINSKIWASFCWKLEHWFQRRWIKWIICVRSNDLLKRNLLSTYTYD